jgi:hypothetical protein
MNELPAKPEILAKIRQSSGLGRQYGYNAAGEFISAQLFRWLGPSIWYPARTRIRWI